MADLARVRRRPVTRTPGAQDIGELLRKLAPQVLGAMVRRYGQFGACEDAVQEAMLEAVASWPARGIPESPKGWLLTVASRRLIDEVRSEHARRRREQDYAAGSAPLEESGLDRDDGRDQDDSLALLFLCCHPALSGPSQVALTLRAVAGLSTAQIAAAFLVPEATMAQRISRAKQAIAASGARFELPSPAEQPARLRIVLHVLYLIFNEGYTVTAGAGLTAPELSSEAIRLTRWLHRLLPQAAETAGLLALMLLTEARRGARTGPDGSLITLDQQDRGKWDHKLIAEGVELISSVLPGGDVGPYQVQAAIAAVHDEATTMDATDWPQILALYDLLEQLAPSPMVSLNRAVAVAMVAGPGAGLDLLATLESDRRLAAHHRLHA
ncbi:MAG: RNA polymerase sigma factor, partial [Actinobacteria bacterium]|nr:RNA polymerase sigma factor [Actinomycetota bacterium]